MSGGRVSEGQAGWLRSAISRPPAALDASVLATQIEVIEQGGAPAALLRAAREVLDEVRISNIWSKPPMGAGAEALRAFLEGATRELTVARQELLVVKELHIEREGKKRATRQRIRGLLQVFVHARARA